MGFGGSAAAMNAAMKNNRNLLKKRKRLKDNLGGYSISEKPEFDFPEATPQVLRAIQERLLLENEILRRRRIIAFIVIASVFIIGFVIIMFN